jgi:ribosomal protein L22
MTEKNYAPTKTEKKTKVDGTSKKQKTEMPVQKASTKKVENKDNKNIENKKIDETSEKKEVKKPAKKIKKDEVSVNVDGVPISTKFSMAICKFIKYKPIEKAIKDLEEVARLKKAVPMKGETPHRKGDIMAGRFPKKASEAFIVLLKSLLANANNHDVEEPIISFAMANIGSRPYGKHGIKRKRTNLVIKARSKKLNNKIRKKNKK